MAAASSIIAGVGVAAAVAGTTHGIVSAEQKKKQAKNAQQRAEAQQELILEEYDALKKEIPSISERLYQLERFKQVGELTPEMEKAILQEESELKKIQLDPAYKRAQMEALDKLQEIADAKGITPVEKAQLARIQNELGNIEKAQRNAILQKAAQMGTLSGGQTLQAQLLASQEAANRGALAGTEMASKAYERALDAISQRGELAGKLRGQEYGEERDVAAAQDIINQANVRQKSDVQMRNIASKNAAQLQNLSEQQRVADLNVRAGQEEARARAAAEEAMFKDKLAIQQGKAGQAGTQAAQQASFANSAQQAASQADAGVSGGLLKIGGGLLDYGIKGVSSGSSSYGPTKEYTTSDSDLIKNPYLGDYTFRK